MDDFEAGPAQGDYDPSMDLLMEEHRDPSLNDIALLKLS